jgi:hypothetical protein
MVTTRSGTRTSRNNNNNNNNLAPRQIENPNGTVTAYKPPSKKFFQSLQKKKGNNFLPYRKYLNAHSGSNSSDGAAASNSVELLAILHNSAYPSMKRYVWSRLQKMKRDGRNLSSSQQEAYNKLKPWINKDKEVQKAKRNAKKSATKKNTSSKKKTAKKNTAPRRSARTRTTSTRLRNFV